MSARIDLALELELAPGTHADMYRAVQPGDGSPAEIARSTVDAWRALWVSQYGAGTEVGMVARWKLDVTGWATGTRACVSGRPDGTSCFDQIQRRLETGLQMFMPAA